MRDWKEKLELFLKFNGREVLKDSGKISHEIALKLVNEEYEKYKYTNKIINKKDDFEQFLIENKLNYSVFPNSSIQVVRNN